MGRGLSAILPRSRAEEVGFREVALDLIVPNPRQPRREFDEAALLTLADSIRSRGVLQPIVVRPVSGGTFELVAGERRLRAARLAELERIPAVVREADDWARLDMALAENMARVDLNPIEEARACAMLVEDLGLTKGEVGRRVGRSRVAVSNLIRLLDLPEEALEQIEAGALSEGHGRAILTCKDHEQRKRLARDAREHGWSVRETERRARALAADEGAGSQARREPEEPHPDLADGLAAAEDALTAALGQPVSIRAAGESVRAELCFESPGEAIELAERLLRRRGESLSRAA
jgi:ParB family chromosome partitioning protein